MINIAVAHQPDFLPHLGFFHKLLNADVFIVMDNVQFVKSPNGMTHRDLIKTSNGKSWLTLSIEKAPQKTTISNINLSKHVNWKNKNLRMLEENYRKSQYFDEIHPFVVELYSKEYKRLIDINIESIRMIMKLLEIDIPLVLLSSLNTTGSKNELLISALEDVGASSYLSGVGSRSYLDSEKFKNKGIKVIWQKYTPIVYMQLFGQFIPNLSSIDMLYNCGIAQSRAFLRKNNFL
jgi:hypothetical protein